MKLVKGCSIITDLIDDYSSKTMIYIRRTLMKKLYSEKEIKESCIKVKRLLPDSCALDNNFSLQYFNAEISKDLREKI